MRLILAAAVVATGFAACNNGHDEVHYVDNLSQFVDSVQNAKPVYTADEWNAINTGYVERQTRAEEHLDKMSAEEKSKFEATKLKYNTVKTEYEIKLKAREEAARKPDYRMVLRNNLFGEGRLGSDIKFDWVTANNIREVYDRFVTSVDKNNDSYSREDWDEIKLLYEALDSRKNEVEKDLATKDNLKIAALKVKFAAIKSVNRPRAKAEENHDAKDK